MRDCTATATIVYLHALVRPYGLSMYLARAFFEEPASMQRRLILKYINRIRIVISLSGQPVVVVAACPVSF